ncbi:hypothetical protein JCM3775_004135 [Rhodotorula graminis]
MARGGFASRATAHADRGPVASLLTSRLAVCIVSVLITLVLSSSWAGPTNTIRRQGSTSATAGTDIASFDLTPVQATAQGAAAGEKLLVLTPLKDAGPYLDEYFENLARLSYPRNLISLAFLVSDSTDNTVAKLRARARRLSQLPPKERYDSITIFERDFKFNLASEVRHGFEGQPVRRAFIAKARNYLLSAALRPDTAYVLWLDVDVVRYDPHILSDLMSVDKDIVVPNTLWHVKDWAFWGFDRNNFAETEESLALLDKLGPDVMLVEGYRELMTSRAHLVDMPTHLGLAHVPLDGIGCTFALVKAHVHREGVTFPTYVFDNQVETEGLAKVAKRAGFEVVGVPGVLVFHAQNH